MERPVGGMVSGSGRVALVTGCSSGIGEATAVALARTGFRVFASGRTQSGVEHLRAVSPNLEPIELDVTSDPSIERAVTRVLESAGRIDVLVNNAGVAIFGAVEDLDRDTLRRQFEVNVFGAVAMCRAVLPAMRRQGRGTIVNVSSVAGRFSTPLLGAYCASKFALEAFSDALRNEARPFGMRVVVVEPGATESGFRDRAARESDAVLGRVGSVYARVYRAALQNYTTPAIATTADRVGRRIARIATRRRPAARYRVRWYDTAAIALTRVLPPRVMDLIVSRWIGLDRLRVAR
ncbi:MAG: SDR family oxidoreductase [Methanobacteriota archaeon]|nr:MAG: SDR family oxidoreductase [Euryarchaeota archaeon]